MLGPFRGDVYDGALLLMCIEVDVGRGCFELTGKTITGETRSSRLYICKPLSLRNPAPLWSREHPYEVGITVHEQLSVRYGFAPY